MNASTFFFRLTCRNDLRAADCRAGLNCRAIPETAWEHARRMLVFYFSRRHQGMDAEDLAQETLARLWSRDDYGFDREEDFLRVCYGFARLILQKGYREARKHAAEALNTSLPAACHCAAAGRRRNRGYCFGRYAVSERRSFGSRNGSSSRMRQRPASTAPPANGTSRTQIMRGCACIARERNWPASRAGHGIARRVLKTIITGRGHTRKEECTMAFLDFIRNRQGQEASARNAPEKNSKTQEAQSAPAKQPESKSNLQSQLSPAHQRDLADAQALFQKGVQERQSPSPQTPAPQGEGGGPAALRQKAEGQERSAPAQSPTDGHRGVTQAETKGPAVTEVREAPSKPPQTPNAKPQTVPRPRPSWER